MSILGFMDGNKPELQSLYPNIVERLVLKGKSTFVS